MYLPAPHPEAGFHLACPEKALAGRPGYQKRSWWEARPRELTRSKVGYLRTAGQADLLGLLPQQGLSGQALKCIQTF